MTNFEKIRLIIEGQDSISVDDSFMFAKIASDLLRENEELGRKIVIYILDNLQKIPPETLEMWTDLIESAGFYPYLEKEKKTLKLNNLAGEVRNGGHLSQSLKWKYLHEEQKYLVNLLQNWKNLIVSAPTSFWKSLLIEEMVASKKFKNILIIQPTLALLDETRKKMKKYQEDYKIIIKTSQEYSAEKWNLFLLTAERVTEYENLPQIDFFVIDEFYKLSAKRDDERSYALNNAFYKILNQDIPPQFYLLWPNIDWISPGFGEKYNAEFYKTNYSLIETNIEDIYSQNKDIFDKTSHYKQEWYEEAILFKEKKLFDLLYSLKNQQSIIYCSSPSRVRELAGKFALFLHGKGLKSVEKLPIIERIKKHISKKRDLINFLNFEIGIHNGVLQKHINSSIIDYFNNWALKYLFCTTTIIEWVNTSAKNVIFFDNTKGKIQHIDYFDYANIKGRSWRMMIHYIGKVYNFNPPPEKQEDMIVDIPFYQQNPIEDEVLNGLKEQDVNQLVKESEQYKELQKIPPDERQIFQKNGVSIRGQKQILNIISDLNEIYTIKRKEYSRCYCIYDLLNRTTIPTYDQLQFVLELCRKYLLKTGESKKVKTVDQLVYLTFNYTRCKDIFSLVDDNLQYIKNLAENKGFSNDILLNKSIEEMFSVMRHWFQYKLPKRLRVTNELQKYVCEQQGKVPGNYTFYSNQIENDFLPENLSILSEYWIPNSAIRKISSLMGGELSEEEVLKKIKQIAMTKNSVLLQYENEKILNNL